MAFLKDKEARAISSLVGRNDHVITDKFNHASIMDGIFLTSGLNQPPDVIQIEMAANNVGQPIEFSFQAVSKVKGGG